MTRRKTHKTGRRVLVFVDSNRVYFLNWHTALLSLFLLQNGALRAECKGVISFDLHPTAVLASQRRRRRRLMNCEQTNSSCLSTFNQSAEEKWWFHPNSNAVYATIPKKEDLSEDGFESDDLLDDFHRYRHISRHERQYRMQLGLDLQPDWDGIYDFDKDYEDGDDDEELHVNATNATNKQAQRLLRQTVTSSVHLGGRFNNYQGVSLSQGYGTHYANAWVGSPTPQRKTLIVDTGSHYTAFPCTGCRNCGLQHHTDPYYNPQKSSTFHVLQCNECREGVTCQGERCLFSQSYTEGSSWEAYQVRDIFYCGGSDFLGAVDPDHQKYAIDFMFGCQLSLNGLFISQLADGIIGMSMYDTTLTKQMYNKGRLEHNIFALCYRRELGSSKRGVSAGSMTLGGVSNSLDTSKIIYAKNMATIGFYTVYVKGIYIRSGGGQSARTPSQGDYKIHKVSLNVHKVNSGKGVIVDSGTTDTYLNKNMARSFNTMWKLVTGRDYANAAISLNDEQLRSLPTILVQCQAYDMRRDPSLNDPDSVVGYVGRLDPSSPTDLLIAIPATNYMEFSPRTKQYSSRVYFTETSGGVLGSNTMQGHNVVFDWENGRIGFAESSCTYDKKDSPQEADEGRYTNDCTLGTAILSQTCIETVDAQLCDNNPSNVALLGTETWTFPVEHPGLESGVSCLEAARRQSPTSELGPSSISCEGNGVCIEARPCQLSCNQLREGKGMRSTEPDPKTENKCENSFWSACDFKCNQTRLESMLHTDGQCHEVTRTSRPCHKDSCGRNDPCRVPFITHSIYVFRGVTPARWSRWEEDVFSEALTRSFHVLAQIDQVLFRAGDVKVVLVRPWLASDEIETVSSIDNEGVEDEALGAKVVVQISIHNPNIETQAKNEAKPEKSATSNIGEMVKNITDALRSNPAPASRCKDADLFMLAKNARLIAYGIPELPNFMEQLILEMLTVETELGPQQRESAFTPLRHIEYNARQSRLVSSWTIRTDVDDEINYYGPPEPLFFTILRYVHRIALVTFCFSLFVFMWGVAVQAMDFVVVAYNTGRRWLPGARDGISEYDSLTAVDTDSETLNHIDKKKVSSIRRRCSIGTHKSESTSGDWNGTLSFEMTSIKSAGQHKKRRGSDASGFPDQGLNHQPSL